MIFTHQTLCNILKLLLEFDFTLNVSLIAIFKNLQGNSNKLNKIHAFEHKFSTRSSYLSLGFAQNRKLFENWHQVLLCSACSSVRSN